MITNIKKKSSASNSGVFPSTSSSEDPNLWKWVISSAKEEENQQLRSGATQPRSNWETYLFDQVSQLIFQMARLPNGHDFHLDADVAMRAADLLETIKSNSLIDAPRVINEEGDTVLFTWEESGLKKYLCIDGEEVEIRVRKPGTPFSASETLSDERHLNVSTLLNALGAGVRSGSVR